MRNPDCLYREVCLHDEVGCDSMCTKYMKMSYCMNHSYLSKDKQIPAKLYADEEDEKSFRQLARLKDNIADVVESGESIYICGENVGNGKTSWSLKLLLKYFDENWPTVNFENCLGVFIHVPTLLLELKDFNNKLAGHYEPDDILKADVVVWDDIAHTSDVSKFDMSNLILFLESRIFHNKSNIFTSNVTTKDELQKVLGSKLANRIFNLSTVVELKGRGQRG